MCWPHWRLCVSVMSASAASPPSTCTSGPPPPTPRSRTSSRSSTSPRRGDRYGRLVTTLPVPGRGNGPHHTEHEMPADGQLFANGFATGQSFVFDLAEPDAAAHRPASSATSRATGTRTRSCGCRTATYSPRSRCGTTAAGMTPGGLVELTPAGAAGAFELGRCARASIRARASTAAHRAGARPDRDDDDRHERRIAGVPQPAGVAALGPRLLHTSRCPMARRQTRAC